MAKQVRDRGVNFQGGVPLEISDLTIYLAASFCLLRMSLQISHHGSEASTSQQFLAAVEPEVAVICVGQGNPFGHPAAEVVGTINDMVGEDNVYQTQDGTIEFVTDGDRLRVSDNELPL